MSHTHTTTYAHVAEDADLWHTARRTEDGGRHVTFHVGTSLSIILSERKDSEPVHTIDRMIAELTLLRAAVVALPAASEAVAHG